MKYFFSIAFILTFSAHCRSQILAEKILNSSGHSFHSDEASLVFSLGEIAIQFYDGDSFYLQEGFLSSDQSLLTSSEEVLDFEHSVFPNPVQSVLTIRDANLKWKSIKINDFFGRLILNVDIENGQVDLRNLSPGLYILQLVNESRKINKTIKLIKN